MFDPICIEQNQGACIACTYVAETSCEHFNQDLSRAFLYGGQIQVGDMYIDIIKGFWG